MHAHGRFTARLDQGLLGLRVSQPWEAWASRCQSFQVRALPSWTTVKLTEAPVAIQSEETVFSSL